MQEDMFIIYYITKIQKKTRQEAIGDGVFWSPLEVRGPWAPAHLALLLICAWPQILCALLKHLYVYLWSTLFCRERLCGANTTQRFNTN